MDKAKLKEKFSQLLNKIENLGKHEDFYTYEKEFVESFEEFENHLFEESLGKRTENRRKKKIKMKYGKVSLPHRSQYYETMKSKKHSPYLSEKLMYIGQSMCYKNGSEAARILLELETNDTEIYRLTDSMGDQLSEEVEQGEYHEIEDIDKSDNIYCQVDGSMLLTREEKWKETKPGRVFKHSSILPQSKYRQWIRSSEYVAHLGGHKRFEHKMSHILDEYSGLDERLVFVNDGSIWIGNWIKAEYPKSSQILDFYHAMTHIIGYATMVINKKERKKWQEQTSIDLKQGGDQYIIKRLKDLPAKTKKQKEKKAKLLSYLKNNETRMAYDQYIEKRITNRIGSYRVSP
jgi:hypothetical protein